MFEILEKDLMGRIGVLETRKGKIETPALAPVVNPAKNVVPPSEIAGVGFPLLMTNAYIILKNYGELGAELGVHRLLGVDVPVMTDSGGYQLMIYGRVDTTPEEILRYQEEIGADIGVILDVPTTLGISREEALARVEETLRRAERALATRQRRDMHLVGPVQGNPFPDLVEYAAERMASLDFEVYAIGASAQLMEQYEFPALVDTIVAAKRHLPPGRPVHLFGGGHPLIIPLAVALGVDLFDSASYALYARDLRYMTESGTVRFERLRELPCSCPVCSKHDLSDLREMPREELERLVALHNLYVLKEEIDRVKQAIHEGSLWELLEQRAQAHPKMMDALAKLGDLVELLERYHPIARQPVFGLFFKSTTSLWRPEVYRHSKRIAERYEPPEADVLLMLPETDEKPYTRFGPVSRLLSAARERGERIHLVVYSPVFGVVPIELSELFPLSQYSLSEYLRRDPERRALRGVVEYLARHRGRYGRAIVVVDRELVDLDVGALEGEVEARDLEVRVVEAPLSSADLEEILRAAST